MSEFINKVCLPYCDRNIVTILIHLITKILVDKMIYLVRHGLTTSGIDVILGQSDPSIVPIREDIVKQLHQILPLEPVVISSPLKRAKDTAKTLFEEFKIDNRLMEMDLGSFAGNPANKETIREIFALQVARNSRDHGGETFNEFIDRVQSMYKQIKDQNEVVLVTHSGWIRALLIEVLELADNSFNLNYLEVIKLDTVKLSFEHISLNGPKTKPTSS